MDKLKDITNATVQITEELNAQRVRAKWQTLALVCSLGVIVLGYGAVKSLPSVTYDKVLEEGEKNKNIMKKIHSRTEQNVQQINEQTSTLKKIYTKTEHRFHQYDFHYALKHLIVLENRTVCIDMTYVESYYASIDKPIGDLSYMTEEALACSPQQLLSTPK